MIDYCKQILGKSIRDLTIEDLKVYFSEVREESEILEFKSGKGDFEGIFNNNILRTVSAFLNSSGGVLIWGAPEDKAPEKGMPKVCEGDLVPVTEKKEKDQLINRISSSISYMPTGVKVERLKFDNGFVYIIEVQESESKPHQLNGQYLIRLDGQSKPAPHYIVDSLFKQVQVADIESESLILKYENNDSTHFIYIGIYYFNFSRNIIGKNIQLHVYVNNGSFTVNSEQNIECPIVPNLHFAVNPISKLIIRISEKELFKSNGKIKIQTTIKADNSYAKTSDYELNITKLKDGFSISDCITRMTNNLSLAEKSFNIDIFENKELFKEFILKNN